VSKQQQTGEESRVRNTVKQAAATGETVRGIHLTFAQPTVIEVLASIKPDFIYIDGEHGAFDVRDVEAACIAAERHGITPIARVPDRSPETIGRFLDRGVLGIAVPHVDSVEDAAAVVQAAYYGPTGSRSFGAGRPEYGLGIEDKPAYLDACNANVSVGIMIESVGGLQAAGEIAALPGIDYLSFGMHDLSQALGFPGDAGHPEVVAAAQEATARIHAAGKRVREDFMRFAWINDVIVAGARQLIG
jgi:4-hydroxy-2-oxoheptanedioate aldolase